MEELENALVEVFNNSGLPFEAKRYVVLAFFRNVEENYRNLKEQARIKAQEGSNDDGRSDSEN